MHNGLKYIAAFVAGAGVGSVITYLAMKNKCEQVINDEINTFKEEYLDVRDDTTEESDDEDDSDDVDRDKYADVLRRTGYTDKFDFSDTKKGGDESMDRPYVIRPDEFDEFEDYDVISLTYYADKVLTDDQNEPVDDVDYVVGYESLEHFGEYEDDSVFVRNDRLEVDYEILLDDRRYSDLYPEGSK
jgi:hypothetical protein